MKRAALPMLLAAPARKKRPFASAGTETGRRHRGKKGKQGKEGKGREEEQQTGRIQAERENPRLRLSIAFFICRHIAILYLSEGTDLGTFHCLQIAATVLCSCHLRGGS